MCWVKSPRVASTRVQCVVTKAAGARVVSGGVMSGGEV